MTHWEFKANTFSSPPNTRYLLGHGTRRVEVLTDSTGRGFCELIRCPESNRVEGCGTLKWFSDCPDHWTVIEVPPFGEPFDCAPQVIEPRDATPAPSTIDACDPVYL